MEAVFSVFSFILALATIIGTAWLLAIPVGIVLMVLKALKKISTRWRTILLIGFGGIGLLIISFVLFFLLNFIAALFGIHVSKISLPTYPASRDSR